MKNLRYTILFLVVTFLIIRGVVAFLNSKEASPASASPADILQDQDISENTEKREFIVEIADTYSKRIKGLSGREFLPENTVLLFVFDEPGYPGIWMKDMKFPIDILWLQGSLSSTLKIVHIEKDISPQTYPTIFYPTALSTHVLEANTGFADVFNLKVGDNLYIQKGTSTNLLMY